MIIPSDWTNGREVSSRLAGPERQRAVALRIMIIIAIWYVRNSNKYKNE